MTRKIPTALTDSWSALAVDPALAALASSHRLHGALARWQATLVKEAVGDGASWEEIGAALGTSKQGAWARFRVVLGDAEGVKVMNDQTSARQRFKEVWEAGQLRLREMDSKWRREQEDLREQVKVSKDRLAEARRRHQRDSREARHNLRRELEATKT